MKSEDLDYAKILSLCTSSRKKAKEEEEKEKEEEEEEEEEERSDFNTQVKKGLIKRVG